MEIGHVGEMELISVLVTLVILLLTECLKICECLRVLSDLC